MTRLILDPEPRWQPANVTIHHLQLRDLIQPAGKDKVLFVNRFKIEQADFSSPTPKPPTTFCTLDFPPNCISVGCGLLAAGGQHSELAIRPLHSPSSGSSTSTRDRDGPAPWLLRTPTGGSINNAISIRYDTDYKQPQASAGQTSASSFNVNDRSNTEWKALHWTRDEPGGRMRSEFLNEQMQLDQNQNEDCPYLDEAGEAVEEGVDENEDLESDLLASAYGFTRTPSLGLNRSSRISTSRGPHLSNDFPSTSTPRASHVSALSPQLPIRLMISNNDQSIKIYRLRQPNTTPGQDGKLESGLPGLTRVKTIDLPTAVNHSSINPDSRTLIAVGDTPDVFIYRYDKEGEFDKVATYTASSDASFSTAWHPDGHQMAVASQDGVISVWDVRSSKKLASLTTSQTGSSNGAARCLKFSPDGNYLAFTEHRNYFHIVDTLTYTDHQKIMVKNGSARGDSTISGASSSSNPGETSLSSRGTMIAAGGERTNRALLQMRAFAHRSPEYIRRFQDQEQRQDGLDSTTFLNEILSGMRPPSPPTTSHFSGSRSRVYRDENQQADESSLSSATNPSLNISADVPSWEESLPIVRRGNDSLSDIQRIRNGQPPTLHSPQEFIPWLVTSSTNSRSREPSINITGLCFCPEGKAVYCATEHHIARYSFIETRKSSQNCGLR